VCAIVCRMRGVSPSARPQAGLLCDKALAYQARGVCVCCHCLALIIQSCVCVCVCVCVTNHWQRGCAYLPVMSRVAVLRTYLQVVWKEARARVVGDERLRDKMWESTGQLTAQIAHNEQAAKAGVLRSH
jgi:hypothetical protein